MPQHMLIGKFIVDCLDCQRIWLNRFIGFAYPPEFGFATNHEDNVLTVAYRAYVALTFDCGGVSHFAGREIDYY